MKNNNPIPALKLCAQACAYLVLLVWFALILAHINRDTPVLDYTNINRITHKQVLSQRALECSNRNFDGLIIELNQYLLSDYTRDDFTGKTNE